MKWPQGLDNRAPIFTNIMWGSREKARFRSSSATAEVTLTSPERCTAAGVVSLGALVDRYRERIAKKNTNHPDQWLFAQEDEPSFDFLPMIEKPFSLKLIGPA